ncbi:MAG TPA: YceI family protein [Verrucomicrobiae bacterium]|jgi:polyisoprenoid-binding protein YceI
MRRFPYCAAILALSLACLVPGRAQTRFNTQPVGNSVKVEGTSSLHDWEMEGLAIGGHLELGGGVSFDKSQAAPTGLQGDKVPAKASALIPVGTIHSKADHLPGTMDDLMQKAMKASDYRLIEFTLTDMTFKAPHEPGKPFNLDTKGELTIAGKTNAVSFPITIEPLDGGKIRIVGGTTVKMTDYGVDPPAPNFGLGMMKVGPDVTIKFDWTLKEKKP